MQTEQLTPQLRSIVDRMDVLDVITRYALAMDNRNWDELGSLFASDAHFEVPGLGEGHGPAGIVDFVGGVVRALDATMHVNCNHLVTVHDDEAGHTGYVVAQHVRRGLPDGELFTVAGRYDDTLRRTPGGWQFTRRTLTVVWSQGNPGVLT